MNFWRQAGSMAGLLLATGCGIGLVAPFAPGTFGSLPGVAFALALARFSWGVQLAVALALAIAAVPLCTAAERRLGIRDDGRITADEWMLFPIAVLGLPLGELSWMQIAVFFAIVRLVDIVKPAPARQLQALPRGWGVVADDFVANLYSLLLNWSVYWGFMR